MRGWMHDFLCALQDRFPSAQPHTLSVRVIKGQEELVATIYVADEPWLVFLDDEDCCGTPSLAAGIVADFLTAKIALEQAGATL